MEKMYQQAEKFSAEEIKIAKQIEHIVLDMDGTIYLGSQLFDFTPRFLEQLRTLNIGYSFLTNNPTRSVGDYVAKLQGLGIAATENDIYTSSLATLDYLDSLDPRPRRLFLLGTPSMQAEFLARGYELCSVDADDEPDAVVVSFDTTLCYDRLCRAAWWVKQGKRYIVTNPDRFCPTDQPTVLVDCGSIASAITMATGREADIVIGKPNPQILTTWAKRKGVQMSHIAMVGDRLATDVQTAHNAGGIGVLVLSGESTAADAAQANPKPHLMLKNVGELGELMEAAKLG